MKTFKFGMDAYKEKCPALNELAIGLFLTPKVGARWQFGDGWTPRREGRSGGMLMVPIATELQFDSFNEHELLVVSSPKEDVEALLEAYQVKSVEALYPLIQSDFLYHEPSRCLLMKIWQESATGDACSALMIDGLWQCFIANLLRLADLPVQSSRYGLTNTDLATIDEYVRENAGERLNTSEMAAIVGLSAGRFSRDFKEATGQTPYQFVMNCRIERACALIRETSNPLGQIAYSCGFSSQSHMTDVFRAKLGLSPGKYRQPKEA